MVNTTARFKNDINLESYTNDSSTKHSSACNAAIHKQPIFYGYRLWVWCN